MGVLSLCSGANHPRTSIKNDKYSRRNTEKSDEAMPRLRLDLAEVVLIKERWLGGIPSLEAAGVGMRDGSLNGMPRQK